MLVGTPSLPILGVRISVVYKCIPNISAPKKLEIVDWVNYVFR
jgi:hypothetical protein